MTITQRITQAGLVPACCVLIAASTAATAQDQGQQATPPVPARDSVFAERTITASDSIPDPWRTLGTLTTESAERTIDLGKMDRRFVQYRSLSELLIRATPYQPLSHGGNAQHNAISVLGGYNADLSISVGGRTVVDPWSNAMHLAQIAPEGAERIEILTGVHAVGLAPQPSLSAINVQEIIHNTPTPYTALWYTQGGGDVIAADVELSQNVGLGMNVTLGVRRSGAVGRYLNTEYDVWNVRAGFRWALADLTHLQFSYHFASLNTGLWGGLRTIVDLNSLTERTSPPVFNQLKDESRRHDLTATFLHAFDEDTTHMVSAQVYGSVNNMLRLRDTTLRVNEDDRGGPVTFHGLHSGVLVRSDHRFSFARLRLGVGADLLSVNATPYTQDLDDVRPQAFGHLRVPLAAGLTAIGALRLSVAHGVPLIGGGAGLEMRLSEQAVISADLSRMQRAPSATEGTALDPEDHLLATASLKGTIGNVAVLAQAFYRSISQPLVTTTDRDAEQFIRTTSTGNGPAWSQTGLITQARWEHTWVDIRPVLRFHLDPGTAGSQRFPTVSGELSAAFVYRVGKNSVRLGGVGRFLTSFAPQQYVPTTWTYTEPVANQGLVGNGLDVFLTAILGNASIRASYEKVFASRWYTTSVAPEIIQDIRLSVTWSFFD